MMFASIDWQMAIVIVILLLCLVWMVRRIRFFFHRNRKNISPCDSCTSDCELKRLFMQQQAKCRDGQGKMKNKCH